MAEIKVHPEIIREEVVRLTDTEPVHEITHGMDQRMDLLEEMDMAQEAVQMDLHLVEDVEGGEEKVDANVISCLTTFNGILSLKF